MVVSLPNQQQFREVGFPNVYWHGVQGDFYIMVMQMLGPNLQ